MNAKNPLKELMDKYPFLESTIKENDIETLQMLSSGIIYNSHVEKINNLFPDDKKIYVKNISTGSTIFPSIIDLDDMLKIDITKSLIEYQKIQHKKTQKIEQQLKKKNPVKRILKSKAFFDRIFNANKNKEQKEIEKLQLELFQSSSKLNQFLGKLTEPVLKTLHGIQVLFYDKKFIEHGKITYLYYQKKNGQTSNISIETPMLQIKFSDLLRAIPISENYTSRGKLEPSGTERKNILTALLHTIPKQDFFVYWIDKERILHMNSKPLISIIETSFPNKKLNNKEIESIQSGNLEILEKHTAELNIVIALNPIITHGVTGDTPNFYVTSPSNFIEELKIVCKRYTNYHILFCQWIFYIATSKTPQNTFKRKITTIAETIFLKHLLDQQQHQRVKDRINEYFEVVKKIGYVKDYQLQGEYYTFTLDLDKIKVKNQMTTTSCK